MPEYVATVLGYRQEVCEADSVAEAKRMAFSECFEPHGSWQHKRTTVEKND